LRALAWARSPRSQYLPRCRGGGRRDSFLPVLNHSMPSQDGLGTVVATKPVEIPRDLADVALLSRKQVLAVLSISASTWHAGIRAGIFMAPIKNQEGHSARWKASYIREVAERYHRGQIPVIEPAAKRPRGKKA
jgi:hypothetical protein